MRLSRSPFVKSLPVTLLALAIGAAALAQEVPDQVPGRLVSALTGGVPVEGLPTDMAGMTLPAGIKVEGSLDRRGSVQVVLSTTLAIPDALAALEGVLVASGWKRLPVFNYVPPQATGFVSSMQAPGQPVDLCKENAGMISLQVPQGAGLLMLMLNRSMGAPGSSFCDMQIQQREQMRQRNEAAAVLQRLMPRLEMPVSPSAPTGTGFFNANGGNFGGTGENETRSSLVTTMTPGQLLENFNRQLESQGWTLDASASGKVSASSSWTRKAEGDRVVYGMLTILQNGKDSYDLRFRLLAPQTGPVIPPAGTDTMIPLPAQGSRYIERR